MENGSARVDDVVRSLGYLTLGTRFKRIGERLQAQTQSVLGSVGIELPASHFPVLAALDRLGPLSVGELTQAVGVSQPGVTRLLDKLAADGLVQSREQAGDRRVRTIVLSRAGRRLVARAKQLAWPAVQAAVADACADPAGTLLARLAALEDALAAVPLATRVARAAAEGRADEPA